MKPFELGKTYKTRNDQNVRVICVDKQHEKFTVVGLIANSTNLESLYVWSKEGKFSTIKDYEHEWDLMPEKETREVWLNVYSNDTVLHSTKETADAKANNYTRIACIPVTIEF